MKSINIEWTSYGQVGLVAGTDERVKSIEGFDGYFITDHGRVLSAFNGTGFGIHINYDSITEKVQQWHGKPAREYWRIALWNNGKRKNFAVHRLVALAFIDNPWNKKYVDHLEYPSNHYKDLEWVTQKENVERGKIGQGLRAKRKSTKVVPNISDKQNTTVKPGRKSLTYTLEDSNGNRIIVSSLNKFCKERGMNSTGFYRGFTVKGYRLVARGE